MNESIMFDFIPNEIEFTNEEMYDQLQSQLSLALQRTLNSEKYTLEQLENLLFFTQSWIEPFVSQVLNFESLSYFSELKTGFEYVKSNWEMSSERPYPKLEKYCEMCNQISCIVDSYDDPEYLASIHFPKELFDLLCEKHSSELKEKESLSAAIACYSYSIMEVYYNFMGYFVSARDKSFAITKCIAQIDNILFSILWWLDGDLQNNPENSYFLIFVRELSSHLSE